MSETKKIAVILAGCGVYDGSEIHESVLTMLAIVKQGAQYSLFAPNIEQHHVINHLTGNEMSEKRNVLTEAARIARGNIKPLSEYKASNFDALIIPGGFGVAKNLSSFAFEGANSQIEKETLRALKETHAACKPIGAICISPAIVAKALGNIEVTIGQDKGTAEIIEQMGGKHCPTNHGEVVIDKTNKIATTPCYMLDANILQIAEGTENIVHATLEMI